MPSAIEHRYALVPPAAAAAAAAAAGGAGSDDVGAGSDDAADGASGAAEALWEAMRLLPPAPCRRWWTAPSARREGAAPSARLVEARRGLTRWRARVGGAPALLSARAAPLHRPFVPCVLESWGA